MNIKDKYIIEEIIKTVKIFLMLLIISHIHKDNRHKTVAKVNSIHGTAKRRH